MRPSSQPATIRRDGRSDGPRASLRAAATGIALAVLALTGCSGSGPDTPPATMAAADPFVPGATADPRFKLGKPYAINGVWYRPAVDWGYVEEGIASWYGPQFHGRATANGERFDMNALSAAHRTLPLPSIVDVTNLENGRSLRLRVNDRGPFAHNRIIDVSRSAAKALGFYRKGTARVRVRLVTDESMRLAGLMPAAMPAPSSPSAPPALPPVATRIAADRSDIGGARRVYAARPFVQAGAFAERGNAKRAGAQLAHLAPVIITYGGLSGPSVYRVRLGPLASADEANRVLAAVVRSGYPGSRVIMQ